MKVCSVELIDIILSELKKASKNQIDDTVRNKLKDIEKCTLAEKYDAIVEISKLDLTKISSFVREVCALDKYYLRPE